MTSSGTITRRPWRSASESGRCAGLVIVRWRQPVCVHEGAVSAHEIVPGGSAARAGLLPKGLLGGILSPTSGKIGRHEEWALNTQRCMKSESWGTQRCIKCNALGAQRCMKFWVQIPCGLTRCRFVPSGSLVGAGLVRAATAWALWGASAGGGSNGSVPRAGMWA